MNKEGASFPVSPLEQEYIASCYPLPDRPGIEDCNRWKEELKVTISQGKQIDLFVSDIKSAFPHLAGLGNKGYFTEISVQEYFEGLDKDGSHNKNLYLFARNLTKALKKSPDPDKAREILSAVLDHVDGCSVRAGDLTSGKVWSFRGINQEEVDQEYFNTRIGQRFVLMHGVSSIGPIAIREISPLEFESYTKWFEKIQKSPRNPFHLLKNE